MVPWRVHCGGPVTLIAKIGDPAVIAKILTHVALPTKAPLWAGAGLQSRLDGLVTYELPTVPQYLDPFFVYKYASQASQPA